MGTLFLARDIEMARTALRVGIASLLLLACLGPRCECGPEVRNPTKIAETSIWASPGAKVAQNHCATKVGRQKGLGKMVTKNEEKVTEM